jgi:hypothetical protein
VERARLVLEVKLSALSRASFIVLDVVVAGGPSASILARDLPVLPLYYRSEFVAVKEKLQNIAPTGDASPLTWNAHTWYWR